MKVLVLDKQKLLQAPGITKLEARLASTFSKFRQDIKSVTLTLSDTNGPRGGVDKECQIVVSVRKSNDVVIKYKSDSIGRSISNVLDRGSRAVRKLVDRRTKSNDQKNARLAFSP